VLTENARRHPSLEEQLHALQQIEECVEAQSRLIDDLLDTTRIIYGKLKIVVQPLSLLAVVRASIRSVEPLASQKNIQLRINSAEAPDEQFAVFGDALRLEQVCWNLVSNAIKFSEPGATIEVNVGTDHERNWLEVVDHGRGIGAQELPHVFERLHQASDQDGQRRADGLGLGLHIVRHIVDLHGGSVTASSDGDGKGARFKVSLPRPEEPVELGQPEASGREL
jgi:signal transduction histidine kinase